MRRFAGVALSMLLVISACGGSDGTETADEEVESDGEQFADALNEMQGAGGGGMLIFDGEEIPIDSVVCAFREDMIDVGTVSGSGHRVLLGTNNSSNPISAQILDHETLQWFPQDMNDGEVVRDGDTFTSEPTLYRNNRDDGIIEASFTVECP